MSIEQEVQRRRTFAIISHPDAGKTTLTEKLLLFGGAIQVAGAVKSNKIKRAVTSDFMEIERQRGISVATSVMGFEYNDLKVNILDTPGHQDFAEDTYRTLSAVDSVIVVIDVAKGVEIQTEKLVKVCRMRKTPVIVFINKLDRSGKDPIDLLDEIEQKLELNVVPLTWPIGMGPDFKGVYNLHQQNLRLFRPHEGKEEEATIDIKDIDDPALDGYVTKQLADELREESTIIREVYPAFDRTPYLNGDISPVFFGSAINNFGVRELLDTFVNIAPTPRPCKAEERLVEPLENKFTGFIFKIHANIDPRHRNRIAFVRVCSGEFQRNKNYLHIRTGKQIKFSSPTSFMAAKKSIVEQAYPGDIVGLHDPGRFKIGDTLTEGELLQFKGVPSFSPEIFQYVINADPMKAKQLSKGLNQLMDEGLAQLFTLQYNGQKLVGTVGQLQFEVLQHRLQHEYGATCRYQSTPFHKACWLTYDDPEQYQQFKKKKRAFIAWDKDEQEVFLAESPWMLKMASQDYPDIQFHTTSEY